jgi:hypothetical protein
VHSYELFWSGVNVVRVPDITEQSGERAVTTSYPEWTHKFSAYYYSVNTNTKRVGFQNIDGHLHDIFRVPGV